MLEIYEVYEYKVTGYDPETCDGVLFAEYIDTFLKWKGGSSGYSDCVVIPADEE
jgi:hypothetical protein